jgi:hypothetical protein
MDYLSTSVLSSPLSKHLIDINDIGLNIELSCTASESLHAQQHLIAGAFHWK